MGIWQHWHRVGQLRWNQFTCAIFGHRQLPMVASLSPLSSRRRWGRGVVPSVLPRWPRPLNEAGLLLSQSHRPLPSRRRPIQVTLHLAAPMTGATFCPVRLLLRRPDVLPNKMSPSPRRPLLRIRNLKGGAVLGAHRRSTRAFLSGPSHLGVRSRGQSRRRRRRPQQPRLLHRRHRLHRLNVQHPMGTDPN